MNPPPDTKVTGAVAVALVLFMVFCSLPGGWPRIAMLAVLAIVGTLIVLASAPKIPR